jgi:hypothetical protein
MPIISVAIIVTSAARLSSALEDPVLCVLPSPVVCPDGRCLLLCVPYGESFQCDAIRFTGVPMLHLMDCDSTRETATSRRFADHGLGGFIVAARVVGAA